jgi:hypothetical protein
MTDQPSPPIVLALGQREIFTNATTAYVRATLERLLPALVMPDPEVFECVEEARREARAQTGLAWDADDKVDQVATDLMRVSFNEQEFLRKQVLDFAFAGLFHLLERSVLKIVLEADKRNCKTVLNAKERKKNLHFKDIQCVLARCGYVTDEQSFTHDLHKLNLISNAVKHGQGGALTQLADEFPDLFLRRAPNETLVPEHLVRTPELLTQLAASVAAFWGSFPTQQYSTES